MSTQTDKNGTAETLARRFHETYERLAPSFGYETRKDTRAFDPQSPNGKLMIAVCSELEAQPSERRLTVDRAMEVVLKWVYKSGEIDYNLITSLLPEERESGETKYVTDLRDRLTKAAQP